MRKTALLAGVVAGVAVALLVVLGGGGGTALADGGPHVIGTTGNATPDKCAGCHRIHTGQTDKLLKQAGTIAQFCYTCHGNGGPGSDLAVQEGTFYGTSSTTVGLRAGGFEQARINTTDPTNSTDNPGAVTIGVLTSPALVNSAHVVDGTTLGTMWGNGKIGDSTTTAVGPSYALSCTSCHDPHGNGNYRILKSVPTGSGALAPGYAIPDTYPKPAVYTVSNYFDMSTGPLPTSLPAGATPAPGQSIFVDTSRWCAQCHTRYLDTRNAPGPTTPACNPDASRQCSGDAIFNYRHTSSGMSVSSSTGATSYVNRACITCHAAHGSNSSMPGDVTAGTHFSSTVPWPGGLGIPSDSQRASLLKMDNRGMCKKCHGNK